MNFITEFGVYGCIGFCVFCEMHGPSVIMCTQGIQWNENRYNNMKTTSIHNHHSTNPSLSSLNQTTTNNNATTITSAETTSNSMNTNPSNIKNDINTHPNQPHSSSLFNRSSPGSSSSLSNKPHHQKMCAGCSPFFPTQNDQHSNKHQGYETYDPEANMWYFSGRYPFASNTYSSIRQVCVRSLSCEFCPGREGPILFGDDRSGYTLCYLFKLKDSQARGSLRWYCFVFMNRDLSFLVASWPFLVSKFRQVALKLQQSAEETYMKDKQNMAQNSVGTFGLTTPDSFLRKRGTQILRPLTELLHDPFLFTRLHMHFSWLLKAYGNRVIEHHSDGKYLIGTFAQDLTEYKDLDSSEIKGTLQDLAKMFGLDILLSIVYELMIGNQVVIRGTDSKRIASIVNIFKLFIASICANISPFSENYQEIWKATLLGLNREAEIPSDVDVSQIVLIDLMNTNGKLQYLIRQPPPTFGSWDHQGSDYIDKIRRLFFVHGESELILNDLVFLKEKWLHKSKMMFAYQKHGKQKKEDALLHLLGCKPGDVPILRFMMKGLDSNTRKGILEIKSS